MQTTFSTPASPVKVSRPLFRPLQQNEQRLCTAREAAYHVRRARYLAVTCRLAGRLTSLCHTTKRAVLDTLARAQQRQENVKLVDLSGTLSIGQ